MVLKRRIEGDVGMIATGAVLQRLRGCQMMKAAPHCKIS